MKEEYKGGDCNINQKKKAETADELEGKIYNYMFLLSLSALIDIYSVYSAITNILQIVNILPMSKWINSSICSLCTRKC